MAKLYKEARQGKLETQDATRFCFILKSIAQLIESSELEQRVDNIERLLDERDGNTSNSLTTH